ncbi:rifampicin phosphotransferase [Anabrus simplex]|uniref:rifampicin phosphotransferase n=1 Tax=Anabrus simplex TaxID=316456 RepID=UPI0035A345FF
MEISVDWFQNVILISLPIIGYIFFFRRRYDQKPKIHGIYSKPDWNFTLKKWWAYMTLQRQKWSSKKEVPDELWHILPTQEDKELEKLQKLRKEESMDSMSIFGTDSKGNYVHLKICRMQHRVSEVWLHLCLEDGTVYQFPDHPHTIIHNNFNKSWNAAGLKLQMCEPLRRWRITFNGLLRRDIHKAWNPHINSDDLEHIKFSFIWRTCSNPVHFQKDWNQSLVSEAIAREPWRDGEWLNMVKEFGKGYDQWGTLHGVVSSPQIQEKVLYLRGLRQRRWGLNHDTWKHRSVNISGIDTTGTMFTIQVAASVRGLTQATFGHVQEANGKQALVNWCDLSLPNLAEHPKCIPKHFVVRFSAGSKEYVACISSTTRNNAVLFGGHPWTSVTYLEPFQCSINSDQAVGVCEFWYRYNGVCPIPLPPYVHHLMEPEVDVETSHLVVSFMNRECQNSSVVGGKGASLALIDSLCDPKLTVPPGFCLTVTALQKQLELVPQLQEAINGLEKVSSGRIQGDLHEKCERTVALFESTPVCDIIKTEVLKALQALGSTGPIAVRSSGVGEDSEDLSAAGQNATFLGLQGEAAILEAIQKCWGSLFTYQSVEYRRQHGQVIQGGMGVVVQVMVPAQCAGVLFTRHPVTGAPDKMLITANYGLGESVVSAQVEPDTITLAREWQGTLKVVDTTCGSKAHKVEMSGTGGVFTQTLEQDKTSQICISTEEQLELGQIGLMLETMFGGPRDIEWAISEGKIYLLQARPITSLDSWSDFELLHELDSPLIADNEVLTTANTGEVLPGATSPLAQSTLVTTLDKGIITAARWETDLYFLKCVSMSHHHAFINVLNSLLRTIEEEITIANKVSDVGIFGHLVTTPELHRLGVERNGAMGPRQKIQNIIQMLSDAIWNNYRTRQAEKLSKNMQLNICHFTTAKVLYYAITLNLKNLLKAAIYHGHISRVSVFSQIVAISILTEGEEDFTADLYNDVALLFTSCSDVISSDVPSSLKVLAEGIVKTQRGEEFCAISPALAVEWMELNAWDTAIEYKKFLLKHGHRCIREFDVLSESWSMKPDEVIKILQTMVKTFNQSAQVRKPLTIQEAVTELKSVKKERTRSILKFLMPWCRRTVACRETSKASLVSIVHEFRVAYRGLAELLQLEGRLPDRQLIYFLTHYELGQLIESRDPTLLAKAMRRRRLWSQWDRLRFQEIVKGIPVPVNAESRSLSGNSKTRVQGTPVCNGTVMGRACVVLSLQEISTLQTGDILITHSTDIGWSPYFPLLGGVVTELGGLISHGAVVAREYGLPCIVGAQSATTFFKTGDTVLLVGSTGVLEKIEETV